MTERLDGNAIAGVAFELFGREMTLATGVCRSCGKASMLAELQVYVTAGFVGRCPGCEAVLLRIVEGPGPDVDGSRRAGDAGAGSLGSSLMAYDEALADRIRDGLADKSDRVREQKMFGALVLTATLPPK